MYYLQYFNLDSFWSLWYWIALLVTWSLTSHWPLGVPYDLIVLADRKGGKFAEQCEALININIDRLLHYVENYGVALTAVVMFLMGALGTLAFYFGVEFCMAVFVIAAPQLLVQAFAVRFSYRARRLGWSGDELRRRLKWRRFGNQLIGLTSVIMAATMMVLIYLIAIGVYTPGGSPAAPAGHVHLS